jgi:nucleotide-binding universal stress UspA family protein
MVAMYNDILLPTDGSEWMQEVIDHAASLAEEHDAALHALYASNTGSLTDLGIESAGESVSQAFEQEGTGALEAVRSQVEGVPLETTLTEGPPAEEITRYAVEADCDLIVMGTHGRSGVDSRPLGRVAQRVVRSATVPVLTVRVSDDKRETNQ